MDKLLLNLVAAGKNPHVSVPVLIAIGMSLAEIWLPEQYEKRLTKTERVFMAYGVIAAANSGPSEKDDKDNSKP